MPGWAPPPPPEPLPEPLPEVDLGGLCIHGVDVDVTEDRAGWIMIRVLLRYENDRDTGLPPPPKGEWKGYPEPGTGPNYFIHRIPRHEWLRWTPEQRRQIIRHQVAFMMVHEVDEWLRFDGVRLVEDPHDPPVRERELAKKCWREQRYLYGYQYDGRELP